MLIYPIQFEADPLNGIDRVVTQVVFADHSRLPLPDVIAAIDAGLASDAKLSELIPQNHSEVDHTVRKAFGVSEEECCATNNLAGIDRQFL
jgi:hypothetical protein